MKKINLTISGVVCALLIGCGGGSGGNSKNIANSNDAFVFSKLSLNSIKKPLTANYNIYEVNFNGDSYLKIELTKSSKFLYKNTGIEYSGNSEILDLNGTTTNYKSGDILPAGEYILKIHNDTNLKKYHPFITFIANDLNYTNIYTFLLKNGKTYIVPPAFAGFFKIHIDDNKCFGIEGGYQNVKLYDLNLSETDYTINDHIECDIPEGEYILYYNNDTIYENSFKIHYEAY